jgi:hypothetical protein
MAVVNCDAIPGSFARSLCSRNSSNNVTCEYVISDIAFFHYFQQDTPLGVFFSVTNYVVIFNGRKVDNKEHNRLYRSFGLLCFGQRLTSRT